MSIAAAQNRPPHLVVIGAGPAGYPAAFRAADLGFRVTLVDARPLPGGTCLHDGCIPTKKLLQFDHILHQVRQLEQEGLSFGTPHIDLEAVRASRFRVSQQLAEGLLQLGRKRRVALIQGQARFLDAHTLDITDRKGASQQIPADYYLVATGSEPIPLPGITVSPRILFSGQALQLDTIPERLLVVGGGYIGLEMGAIYSALGSAVTLIEMQSRLLPEADPALVQPVTRSVTAPFEHVRTNTVLKDAVTESDGIRAILSCKGQTEEQLYSGMLVAIGRRPFTGGLGLEHTAVQTDAKGFIQTDAFGRTAEPHIYAAGDVAGPPMLAHKATHQGLRAAEHLAGIDTPATPCPVPAVVFTSPEIAWAGLTERAARQARRKVKVLRFPWAASGRALASGGTHGSTRLITDPETGIVLGAGITGTHAGELISEAVLAIQQGLHADTLAQVIHPHPTLSETIGEAAALFSGACIHLHGKR